MKNSTNNSFLGQAKRKKCPKMVLSFLTAIVVLSTTGYSTFSAYALEEKPASSSQQQTVSSEQAVAGSDSSVSSENSDTESSSTPVVSSENVSSPQSSSAAQDTSSSEDASSSTLNIPVSISENEGSTTIPMEAEAFIEPAAVVNNEVVIDFSQPWDYSGQNGYHILGSGEFRLFNPNYHYILKNASSSQIYVFAGSGLNYNDSPGVYNVTLENATISPWEWNMASFNVGNGSTVNLELIGHNSITAGQNWVNTRPLVSVPANSKLNIKGTGSLSLTSGISSRTGAAIGSDGSGAFGDIYIFGGTINIDVANTSAIGLGGNSTGTLLISNDAKVTVYGAANKPAIGIGTGGNIQIAGNSSVTAYGNSTGMGIGGNTAGTVSIEQNAKVTATGGSNGAGIGFVGQGNVIMGANSTVVATGGLDSAGIGVSGNGRIFIVDSANVTAIGGLNGVGIGAYDGASGSILQIDEGASLRAYANMNYAVKANSSSGKALAVNAYYANDAIENTFAPLSTSASTQIINVEPNVVLPKNYTSFAYTGENPAYQNRVMNGTNEYSLVQLDDTAAVNASSDLQPVALKLGVIYEINYYLSTVAPENLVGTISSSGQTAFGMQTDPSVKTAAKTIDGILDASGIENDLKTPLWMDIFKPSEGFNSGTVENADFGTYKLTTNHYSVNVVYAPFKYSVTYIAQDATGGVVPNDAAKYKAGEVFVVKSGEPARNGFTFEGWKADFNNTSYKSGDSITMPAKSVVLTAQWKAQPASSTPSSTPKPVSSSTPSTSSQVIASSSSRAASSSESKQQTSSTTSSYVPVPSSQQARSTTSITSSRATSSSPSSSSSVSSQQTVSESISPVSSSASNSTSSSSTPPSPAVTEDSGQPPAENQREEVIDRLIDNGVPSVSIGDSTIPLFGNGETFIWSLLSLLLAVGSLILSMISIIRIILNRRQKQLANHIIFKSVVSALGIISFILFFLVYSLNGAMVFVDSRTMVFAIFAAAQLILTLIAKSLFKNDDTNNKDSFVEQ